MYVCIYIYYKRCDLILYIVYAAPLISFYYTSYAVINLTCVICYIKIAISNINLF